MHIGNKLDRYQCDGTKSLIFKDARKWGGQRNSHSQKTKKSCSPGNSGGQVCLWPLVGNKNKISWGRTEIVPLCQNYIIVEHLILECLNSKTKSQINLLHTSLTQVSIENPIILHSKIFCSLLRQGMKKRINLTWNQIWVFDQLFSFQA